MCLFDGNPAKASARLQTWQFDTTQNRLFFSTESGVQPLVKLLDDPKRVVIDLPGIVSAEAIGDQLVGGMVTAVRVTQLDGSTTRIVMELSPDYNLDPLKIKVWGLTSQQWVVQLPSALPSENEAAAIAADTAAKAIDLFDPPPIPRGSSSPQPLTDEPIPGSPLPPLLSRNQVSHAEVSGTATLLQGVTATPEGFFLQTLGMAPPIQVYRTRDSNQERQLVIDVMNTMIDPGLTGDTIPDGSYGVRRWHVAQFRTTPPAVRITLNLDPGSPDWQVAPLAQGGLMLTPMGISARQIPPPPTTVVLPVIRTGPTAAAPPAAPPVAGRVNPPPSVGAPGGASVGASVGTDGGTAMGGVSAPPPIARTGGSTGMVPRVAQANPTSPPPHQGRVMVMIDPGHGGADPGAIGIGGLQEKGVVIAVSQQVAAILRSQGVMVQMTRQGDQTVDLQPRVDMAEAADATLFVSIHANAVNMQRPDVNGLETYYYSDRGAGLATVLHRRVLNTMAMNDRGVRQARFFVLRRTSMPAALIEIGFVTGATDAPKLKDPNWQTQMGQAIAAGILDYIRSSQL